MMPAVCLERSKKQFSFCLAFLSGGASSPSEPFQPFERLARSARPTKYEFRQELILDPFSLDWIP